MRGRLHLCKHLLDMRDRGFLEDAVAEVEDVGPAGECVKDCD